MQPVLIETKLFDTNVVITVKTNSYTNSIDYVSPLHCHPDYEIHYVESGYFQFSANEKVYDCPKNSLVFIPPKTYHSLTTLKPGIRISFQFHVKQKNAKPQDEAPFLFPDEFLTRSCHLECIYEFINILSQYKNTPSLLHQQKLEHIATTVFLDTLEQLNMVHPSLLPALEVDPVSESVLSDQILDFIMNNYYLRLTLDDLANHLHLSPRQTERVIKKEMGNTFLGLLNEYRIRSAKNLIRQNLLPMEQIAYEVGFHTYNNFWKTFQKYVGTSPTEYQSTPED